MPHLVLAFDPTTSIVLYSATDGAEELQLPFPVAALLCSLRSYAEQSGWLLQDIQLEHCMQAYHKWVYGDYGRAANQHALRCDPASLWGLHLRGCSGLLWLMITSDSLLEPEHLRNILQV